MSTIPLAEESADTATRATPTTRFHVTLCVANLAKSVYFYECLLGRSPALSYGNYARFDVESPALVLVLYAGSRPPGGALNHVGLRLTSSAELVELQRRMESAGISTQRQEGVECCYAKQTKFWVTDPDGTLWELYVLEGDIEHSGFDDVPQAKQVKSDAEAKSIWLHRLTDPLPSRIFCLDASVDEVRLEGTFNIPLDKQRQTKLLADVKRILRPGGKLVVHGLVGDKPYPGEPKLPGLASLVRHVPVEGELQTVLQRAGFENLFYETLSDVNCISQDDIDLRQCLLVGYRPSDSARCASQHVLYRGPLAQVRDEEGNVYQRGVRVKVMADTAERLRSGPAADQFAFLTSDNDAVSSSLPMAKDCCNC
jgi:catechol 2,3-dioxygenase-like lactoylglutathione lyase family enzyme